MLVGQIIGTGIFSNPALILQNCGSGGMMLILWIIGAVFAGTGVWSYLELGTMVIFLSRFKTFYVNMISDNNVSFKQLPRRYDRLALQCKYHLV